MQAGATSGATPAVPAPATEAAARPGTAGAVPDVAPVGASAAPPAQVAAAPAVAADSVATAGTDAAASSAAPAAPAQVTRPAGVTFPVRPAATTATQAAPAVGHASAADAGSIGGALFSLVLVVGLILALGWLAKRMPGLQRGAGNSNLKVVASVALGPRERAVVVDVGGTQLLLGVGQGGVRTLHTLDAPLPAAETSSVASPFAQILSQHFGRKS